ncbi:MAG: hypothetical protein JNM19_09900 [Chitinophagaceae bacterium]|nr:hypothetical protein [Chitinophagaceae bacterium]
MKPQLLIALTIVAAQLSFTVAETTAPVAKPTVTSPSAWEVLGSRSVRYGTDHDAITVSSEKWYKGIYFKVTDAPIKLNDMKVFFDNGDKFDVSIRGMIRENGHSRTIELPGGVRRITKVEFSYETMGSNRGTANLTLWGKY